MTTGLQFLRSRRSFFVLLAFAAALPHALLADDTRRSHTIPFQVEWDIRPPNSSILEDFLVTEYRNYYIYVYFVRGGKVDIGELRKFTGDSAVQIVTKDPVRAVVIPKTTEEERRADELIRQGVYELRYIHPGIVMPVDLKLEKLDTTRDTAVSTIIEKTFDTDRAWFGLDRLITVAALKPGKYRIKVRTVRETYLPLGAKSYLAIAYRPNTRVLREKD